MNWLAEIEKLVDRKPEWHTRLMNSIGCGFVQHLALVIDLCQECNAPRSSVYVISLAVSNYQKNAEHEIWEDAYPIKPNA